MVAPLLAIAAAVLAASLARAQPGALDPTFGSSGVGRRCGLRARRRPILDGRPRGVPEGPPGAGDAGPRSRRCGRRWSRRPRSWTRKPGRRACAVHAAARVRARHPEADRLRARAL